MMKNSSENPFLAQEWSMTPNSTVAHIFDYRPNGMAVSLCRFKLRELSLLRRARDDESKCKMCLKVLNAK
jgi:hypothetical protein